MVDLRRTPRPGRERGVGTREWRYSTIGTNVHRYFISALTMTPTSKTYYHLSRSQNPTPVNY